MDTESILKFDLPLLQTKNSSINTTTQHKPSYLKKSKVVPQCLKSANSDKCCGCHHEINYYIKVITSHAVCQIYLPANKYSSALSVSISLL